MSENILIIVESPTKAATITKFLPKGCTVLASYGHIRALPVDKLGIDVENDYLPEFVIIDGKQKVISQMKTAMKKADKLYLATDEDREGESISWHLLKVLQPEKYGIPYRRMVFHEITKSAILKAFEQGRDIDDNMVEAQEARRMLDRLFGYTVSPVLWKKLSNKTLSAGRVQSPGLRLIVERERARMGFKTSKFWNIRADFSVNGTGFSAFLIEAGGKKIADSKSFNSETGEYNAKSSTLLLNEPQCIEINGKLNGCDWVVSDVRDKAVIQRPAPPFITSTLQQEANRKLRLSTKDTMRLAQSLYENGFITYMRTDSPALSDEGTSAARTAVENSYGKAYLPEKPRFYAAKSANAQEAHEAIRPATASGSFTAPNATGLSGKELALYTLIYKRTLASQMCDAKKTATTVQINCADCVFEVSGSRIEFPGYLRAYVESFDDGTSDDAENLLPSLSSGMPLNPISAENVCHETKLPPRYTEASLVQALEKLGIGRPSTYASIIDRILEKDYVRKESGTLVPTFSGFGVISLLENNFGKLIDYGFTKDMEDSLDKISNGESGKLVYLKQFYEGPSGLKAHCEKSMGTITPKSAKTIVLPQLGEDKPVYLGPFGAYITAGGKNCTVSSDVLPYQMTAEKYAEIACGPLPAPEVGKSEDGETITLKKGRFGLYWQFGETKVTVPREFEKKAETVGTETITALSKLPKVLGKDGNGNDVVANIGKFGPYVSCAGNNCSVKGVSKLLSMTIDDALELLSAPKPEKKNEKKGGVAAKGTVFAVDFGEYEGKKLGILSGKFGYYIKHGTQNYAIDKKYKDSLDECMKITREQAISYLVKKER